MQFFEQPHRPFLRKLKCLRFRAGQIAVDVARKNGVDNCITGVDREVQRGLLRNDEKNGSLIIHGRAEGRQEKIKTFVLPITSIRATIPSVETRDPAKAEKNIPFAGFLKKAFASQ